MAPKEKPTHTISNNAGQTPLQIIYKHRNRLVEKLSEDWPITYRKEFQDKIRILDIVINEIRNH